MGPVAYCGPRLNTVVYGAMNTSQLRPAEWVNAGLKALAKSGFTALKADTLAKALGVSRGSFYWHFADVAAFHQAVLGAWETLATNDIIAAVEAKGGDAGARLHALAAIVFAQEGALERQMRAWAAHSPAASAVQARVDRTRCRYVEQLYRAAGFGEDEATFRAGFLYRALIGQFAMGKRTAPPLEDAHAMVDLLLAPRQK
jgi:AcrR family transcriptional regulator